MKLASGVSPVPKLRKAGVAVGLGSDGPASNNDLNLFEEIDLALKLQKITSGDPAVLSARDGVEMATIGGRERSTWTSRSARSSPASAPT